MDTLEKQIIESLKTQGSTSTRGLCNRIYIENLNGYLIIPGKEKMRAIYYRLRKLEKTGFIKLDYPGHWLYNLEQLTITNASPVGEGDKLPF
jgi:hypothetical protein